MECAALFRDGDVFIEALHLRFDFGFANRSRASTSLKPRNFHDFSMCGGSGVDGTRVQVQLVRNLALAARERGAIFEIADDGRSERCQMHANLVRAPRQRLCGDPGIFIARVIDHDIIGQRVFRVFVVDVLADNALIAAMRPVAPLFRQRQLDRAAFFLRHAFHERPIDFLGVAFCQQLRQQRRHRGGTRDKQHAGRVAVEPMHQLGALLLFIHERAQHPVHMLGEARAALRRKPGRLVQNDDRGVHVDDGILDGLILRLIHLCALCGCFFELLGRAGVDAFQLRRQAKHLACGQPLARLGALAVHPDLTLAQQLLQHDVAERRVVALEPAIDPDVVVVFGNVDGLGHSALSGVVDGSRGVT